jgi:succinate-acetate transporter protein
MPSTETEEGNTPHSSDDARPPVKTAMSQLANPAPLGLFGFAVITTFSGFLKVDGNSALATDGLRAYIGL